MHNYMVKYTLIFDVVNYTMTIEEAQEIARNAALHGATGVTVEKL